MSATERDRENAVRALRHQLGAEDIERVAAALAAERERARAPFLALAERAERHGYNIDPDDVLAYAQDEP